ncbi:MAG: hypothetical protein QMC93_00605 [Patescibacteria group bacterium]|nr:hypothetical protein [Patescibacteria group bacterium]
MYQVYQVIILPYFKRQLKYYVKKHRHLKDDVISVLERFNKKQHIHLEGNIYKIRLPSRDIPRGKSKSFRLIILVIERGKFIVPITVYFKGNKEDITKKELNKHLETILFELKSEGLLSYNFR